MLPGKGDGMPALFCSRSGTLPTVAKRGALLKAGGIWGSLQKLDGKPLTGVYIDYALYYQWAELELEAQTSPEHSSLSGSSGQGTQTLKIRGEVQDLEPSSSTSPGPLPPGVAACCQ